MKFLNSLYEIFPQRIPQNGTEDYERLLEFYEDLEPGAGITATAQGINQILALLITLVFALVGGVITGKYSYLIRVKWLKFEKYTF